MEVSDLPASIRSTLCPCLQGTSFSVANINCKLSLSRKMLKMNTGPRRIFMLRNTPSSIVNQIPHGTIEIDDHNNTAVCVSIFVVLHYTSQECDVTQYNSKI